MAKQRDATLRVLRAKIKELTKAGFVLHIKKTEEIEELMKRIQELEFLGWENIKLREQIKELEADVVRRNKGIYDSGYHTELRKEIADLKKEIRSALESLGDYQRSGESMAEDIEVARLILEKALRPEKRGEKK